MVLQKIFLMFAVPIYSLPAVASANDDCPDCPVEWHQWRGDHRRWCQKLIESKSC